METPLIIYDLLDSLMATSGLKACLYDTNDFFIKNYGFLKKSYRGHYCSFCVAIKTLKNGAALCDGNDINLCRQLAESYRQPFLNTCHAGLTECIVPIIQREDIIGLLFVGQCIIKDESTFEQIYERISAHGADFNYFKTLYEELAQVDKNTLLSAGKLADWAFKTLVELPKSVITQSNPDIVGQAKIYIENHYMSNLSLDAISQKLHVNPSYLSRIFHNGAGVTISDYIIEARIFQAEKLLRHTKIPISHISYNTGFSDPNYFSRCFKKLKNISPSEYREKYQDK